MLAIAISFWTGSAVAYSPNGTMLALDQRPMPVSVQVDPQVPGFSVSEVYADVAAAVRGWDDTSCAVALDWKGPAAEGAEGTLHLVFAPLGRTGPPYLDQALPGPVRVVDTRGEVTFVAPDLGTVVINTDLDLASEASIRAETCDGQVALSRVVGEVIGQKLGLGFSTWRDSVMARQRPVCTIVRPRADDVAGMSDLYDPYVDLTCTGGDDPLQEGIVGVAPLDVACSLRVDPASSVLDTVWRWGDGAEEPNSDGRHTYETSDNFDLRVNLNASHRSCGLWSERVEKLAFATACAAPSPAIRVERVAGLRFRLVNASDVNVLGCIDDARWQVRDERGEPVVEETVWEPLVDLPAEGQYTVELWLQGRGGEGRTTVEVDTREGSPRGFDMGTGCASTPGGVMWVGWGSVLLVVAARRRR
jgi:hypothetical protein